MISGSFMGYGSNLETTPTSTLKRIKIFTHLTKSRGKIRWAIMMGFITGSEKQAIAYRLTKEGYDYYKEEL